MRTQRQLRVGEEIRHALATVFQRGDVPWPQRYRNAGDVPVVTITEVQVSPDLKNAAVFIMPLGGLRLKETAKAMNEIVGYFRHEVAKTVALRYAPRLRFMTDESFEYATKIDKILREPEVAKDLETAGDAEEE